MAIPLFPIVYYPDDVLSQPTAPVTVFGKPLNQVIRRMFPTMHAAVGIGLAANQVGLNQSFAVVEYEPSEGDPRSEVVPPQVLVNPVILETNDVFDELDEGCLSCPGIELTIRRPTKIVVRFQTIDGATVTQSVEGFPARIFQHEIDHLNGMLILDRAHRQPALVRAYRANPARFFPKTMDGLHGN